MDPEDSDAKSNSTVFRWEFLGHDTSVWPKNWQHNWSQKPEVRKKHDFESFKQEVSQFL